jgi:type I restriction enzyme M protein
MNLADILKDSNYKLSQFTEADIDQLEQAITVKESKSGEVPYQISLLFATPRELLLFTLDDF